MKSDGYILTNNHVIAPAASGGTLTVLFSDGKTAPAVLVTISRGDTGDSVRALQSELTANGIRVTVDGIFGPQTLTAVHRFEARYRFAGALGVIGPATWNALISHGK